MSTYPRLLNNPFRFSWVEKGKGSISFTTINRRNDARNECYLNRHWGLFNFNIYKTDTDGSDLEWRLSFALLWFSMNLHLCYVPEDGFKGWEDTCRYGWHFMDRSSFTASWGKHRWTFDLPFISTIFHRHEILTPERKVAWVRPNDRGRFTEVMDLERAAKAPHTRTFPYRYVRKNGEVQERTVDVYFGRTYRRYKWTPFCNVETHMNYWFSEEVGEGVDGWKGGVLGSAIKALPGETLEQCVRRLEQTVKFSR